MTNKTIQVVGLDADDTLWHSEVYFERTQRRFDELVGRYVSADVDVHAALTAVERRNLGRYGYGIKGFTLSMIECAIEVTDGAIGVEELGQVLAAGRAMLDHPVDLIDGVDETITALADAGYRMVIVTKGDLHHQEMKVMASGLPTGWSASRSWRRRTWRPTAGWWPRWTSNRTSSPWWATR